MKQTLLIALICFLSLFALSKANYVGKVLIISDDIGDISNLVEALVSLQYNVTKNTYSFSTPPSDVFDYDVIWFQTVFRSISSTWENTLSSFIQDARKGVLFFGDNQSCCSSDDISISEFIKQNTYVSDIYTISGNGYCSIVAPSSQATSCVTSTPNNIINDDLTFNSFSVFQGNYEDRNVFVEADNGAAGLLFSSGDLVSSKKGAIMAVLDVNWTIGSSGGAFEIQEIVQNIMNFLTNQCVASTPSPTPSPITPPDDEVFTCCIYSNPILREYAITCVPTVRICLEPVDFEIAYTKKVGDCKSCWPEFDN
eukprot:TRINITY_DN412_c0_g1_i1.p1 TRINITY_DN412_c0_g1~~TRINITY_DN412_c0_g1_i1.p1  ORF type:complete len:311 (-),score=97.45 TRINITY_DN412_c0_g1_i1:148-1080(-)